MKLHCSEINFKLNKTNFIVYKFVYMEVNVDFQQQSINPIRNIQLDLKIKYNIAI